PACRARRSPRGAGRPRPADLCRLCADSPCRLPVAVPALYRGPVALRRPLLPLVLALAGIVLLAVALIRHGGAPAAPALLASWTLTPGVLNPEVTQATIGRTICVRGWTRTIRPPSAYTSGLKLEQLRRLGLRRSPR